MIKTKVQLAIEQLRAGGLVIVIDDHDREGEGDLVGLASQATAAKVNFMTKYARGLMCVPMAASVAARLQLSPMTAHNTDPFGTAFTLSVDHQSTTTGISAYDRWRTITQLANPDASANDFYRPGHLFPLVAKAGGVLERNGHTEAAVDLARLAGEPPVAYICEILGAQGTMATLAELREMAQEFALPLITIQELQAYRKSVLSQPVAPVKLPSKYGNFTLHRFANDNLALVKGELTGAAPVLVRLHSECLTGDVFGSLRCDCGEQLHVALQQIERAGRGVLLYLRQEGRDIGLANKLRAYHLQEQGYDTVEANEKLGLPADGRQYDQAARMLKALGATHVDLLTNNPAKIEQLRRLGIKVHQRLPLKIAPNDYDYQYLMTKQRKFHHLLDLGD